MGEGREKRGMGKGKEGGRMTGGKGRQHSEQDVFVSPPGSWIVHGGGETKAGRPYNPISPPTPQYNNTTGKRT